MSSMKPLPQQTRDAQQVRRSQAESDPMLDHDESKHKKRRRYQLLFAAFITVVMAAALIFGLVYVATEGKSTSELTKNVFKRAAVAADSSQCSTVGKDILLQGGNAVDAAIATLLCSGLTSAQSMGIGGGFIMTIYNKTTGLSRVIDARETAPGKATVDMFHGNPAASASGPLSIAIPGEIRGYWLAHTKYGRFPWQNLFQPAIKMAADGFPVPIGLHKAIQDAKTLLSTEPSLKIIFINPKTGELFKEGEIITRPQLSETLRVISQEGVQAFYNGSLTESIILDLQEIGSIITREDLFSYTALDKTPLEIELDGGIKMVSPPPPSSGAILSFILNILNGYKFTSNDLITDQTTTLTYHRIIEAFKFAYARRTDLGDWDFISVTELVKNLTSPAYADSIRKLITDNTTHEYGYYGPTFYSQDKTGTSHLSVLDQYGNAVSVTSTINGRFGCKQRGMRTGIIFNNEMDDFSSPNITNEYGVPPSPANFIVPGKRPLSSMCPAVFINPDGSVNEILGAAGGTKITTATAWVGAHSLWLGQTIKKAVDAPRLHHQLLPPQIDYETGFKQSIVDALHKLGHDVNESPAGQSIVQAIQIRDGLVFAVSDFRKGGTPDGF